MRLLAPEGIELGGLLAELCTAHDGVVAEHETAVADKSRHRNELHGSHMFALALVLRHKGAGPRGRVLHERAGELHAGLVRVTEGVRRTGVRNTASGIGLGRSALRKSGATAIARHFHIAAFVARGRVTVVDPEERADSHLLARLHKANVLFGSELDHLARAQIAHVLKTQVGERTALLHGNHRAFLAAKDYRRTAPLVAARIETAGAIDEQYRAAALHLLVHVLETVDDGSLRGDERGDNFRRADHSARGGILELHAVVVEELVLQFLDVRNETHRHDGERPELGTHHQRLRVGVRDNADTDIARKTGNVVFELAAERRILDVVNGAVEVSVRLQDGHTAAMGSEV